MQDNAPALLSKDEIADSDSSSDETNQIIDCGILSSITWPGKVSAREMLKNGKLNSDKLTQAINRLNEFYVEVNPLAKTRCIDGRHDPDLNEKMLGPQVPGGAPGAALAYRLGVDKDDLTRGTFVNDAETMIGNFVRLGFAPGGHRDEQSAGQSVGCGAIDGMDKILAAMTDPDLVDEHKRVTKLLLGPRFDRDTYLRVMGAAVVVNGRSKDYFANRKAIIEILEKRYKKSISVLKGSHQECIVAVNLVPNTTFSSNKFSQEFDGMQAFGYDLWRSLDMANRILPRPDQYIDRQRFIMARVMSTIATLMALTDGSQRLIIRMPAGQLPLDFS